LVGWQVNPSEDNCRVVVQNLDPSWDAEQFKALVQPAVAKLRGLGEVKFVPPKEEEGPEEEREEGESSPVNGSVTESITHSLTHSFSPSIHL
jgi:hypothetical protein